MGGFGDRGGASDCPPLSLSATFGSTGASGWEPLPETGMLPELIITSGLPLMKMAPCVRVMVLPPTFRPSMAPASMRIDNPALIWRVVPTSRASLRPILT